MKIPNARQAQASITKPSSPDREMLMELERTAFARALEQAVNENRNIFRYIARYHDEKIFEELLVEIEAAGYYIEDIPVHDRRYKDGIRGHLTFQRDVHIHTPDHVLQARVRLEEQKLEDFKRWRAEQAARRGPKLPPDPVTVLPSASELAASDQEQRVGLQLRMGCLFLALLPLVIWGWITLLNQN